MSWDSVIKLLLLLSFISSSLGVLKDTENEILSDGSTIKISLMNHSLHEAVSKYVSFAPTSNIMISVTNITSSASFVIIQVHTYQYNVTLSYDKAGLNNVPSRSVFGSNIGLFVQINSKPLVQLYVKNDNVRSVDAMIAVTAYDSEAPIPGGCNMEFNTEVAPYKKLVVRNAVVIVDAQAASIPVVSGLQPHCQVNPVQHEMYRMYLSEQDFDPLSYFAAIESMLTVDDIIKNGLKVPRPYAQSALRRVFSAYPGIGSVYVAVATYKNHSSAYVPAFSYACNPVLFPETCQMLNDSLSKLFCAAVFFLGFFCISLSHSCPNASASLPIFFVGSIIGYSIITVTNDFSTQSNICIAASLGVATVLLWTCFFACCSCSFFSLALGFFIASVAYFRAPDSFTFLQNDWIFWMLFVTIAVMISVLMTTCSQTVTCIVYSTYMMILPLDYYAGSMMKYITINVIRRLTDPDFSAAVIQPPFQTKDIYLTVLWIVLGVICVVKVFGGLSLISPLIKVIPKMDIITERTPLFTARHVGRIVIRNT